MSTDPRDVYPQVVFTNGSSNVVMHPEYGLVPAQCEVRRFPDGRRLLYDCARAALWGLPSQEEVRPKVEPPVSSDAKDRVHDAWAASDLGDFFLPPFREREVALTVKEFLLRDPAQTATFRELLCEYAYRLSQCASYKLRWFKRPGTPLSGVMLERHNPQPAGPGELGAYRAEVERRVEVPSTSQVLHLEIDPVLVVLSVPYTLVPQQTTMWLINAVSNHQSRWPASALAEAGLLDPMEPLLDLLRHPYQPWSIKVTDSPDPAYTLSVRIAGDQP